MRAVLTTLSSVKIQFCHIQLIYSVPLYDTLGHDAIAYIINQTEMSVVVAAQDKLDNLFQASKNCPTLKHVIKIGQLTPGKKLVY